MESFLIKNSIEHKRITFEYCSWSPLSLTGEYANSMQWGTPGIEWKHRVLIVIPWNTGIHCYSTGNRWTSKHGNRNHREAAPHMRCFRMNVTSLQVIHKMQMGSNQSLFNKTLMLIIFIRVKEHRFKVLFKLLKIWLSL